MRVTVGVSLIVLSLSACTVKEATQPWEPPPNMPDDLSTWSVPQMIPRPPMPPTVAPVAPSVRPAAANEALYEYAPSKEYVAEVQLGWPVDVVLEAGEKVHNIVGGDRQPLQEGEQPRWEVKEGVSDSQYTSVPHIFFTASHRGQEMGVIITTSRRVYYLTVKSVKQTAIRAIRWTYPFSPAALEPPPKLVRILPDPAVPARYHIGYRWDLLNAKGEVVAKPTTVPDWVPRQVFDDGRKTYFIFSPVVLYGEAPLLRLIGPQGPQLVNSRQVGPVYVIDQLIAQAELRVGAGEHAVIVGIKRGQGQTVHCPGDEACPVWPQESY